jgi:hypothetical protein
MPIPKDTRDRPPDYAERVRRMGDLIAAPAMPVADAAMLLDLPLRTMDQLRAQGKGPRTFKIGRRLFVRQADLRDWLDQMADSERA